MTNIKARLEVRSGTLAQWTAANPVLLEGEVGYETDTRRLRVGDGVTAFLSLHFLESRTEPVGPELVPAGVIVMWSGAVASIPPSWALCNGSNGTPDLRDRFIVGAGGSYEVGDIGGSASVQLTSAEIPAHNHNVSLQTDIQGCLLYTSDAADE